MIAGLGAAAEEAKGLAQKPHLALFVRSHLESLLKAELGSENVVVNFENSERLPNTANVSFRGLPAHVTGKDILAGCSRVLASTGAACHSNASGGSSKFNRLLPLFRLQSTVHWALLCDLPSQSSRTCGNNSAYKVLF
jgi:cysteine sulfinate desulfinase/cysteine desulfurase-like protein